MSTRRGPLPLLALALGLSAAGCGRSGPGAETRLALALDALQQGRLDEAARNLAAIPPGGGWLRSASWAAPLALRLRGQIALKLGEQEECRRLLKEYDARYGGLAPGAYARDRLGFLDRYKDWSGAPALLFLKGVEASESTPAVALREWRTLVRDYPQSAIAATAGLRLGLLQIRLGNAAWAMADLAPAAQLSATMLDPDGNPIAPQALLAMGEGNRDLLVDEPAARAAFEAAAARFPKAVLTGPGGSPSASVAALAGFALGRMDLAKGSAARLEALADASFAPTGFVSADLIGDLRGEVRLALAEANLKRRDAKRARERLLQVAALSPDLARGAPDGPRRAYGYEAIDWLATRVAARSVAEALGGLEELAGSARRRELWAYAQYQRIRLLARLGRSADAHAVLAELERRAPALDVDADGTGMLLVPARDARRLLGG